MTTDEQRQILYAALMRHSPEAGSLRERALDRFVLVALLGSSQSDPMTVEQVQRLTVLVPNSPGLRTDVIEETLSRLIRDEKVEQVAPDAEGAYCLTDTGRDNTDEAAESAAHLFLPVLDRMLRNTAGLFPIDDGKTVCRTFISECFARFGHQIAKAVTGDLSNDGMFGGADINGAFLAALATVSVTDEAAQSLRARCYGFLRSTEPGDQDLKFRLSQSYYVVQLLELSPRDFNPLAEDAFQGAIFYVDTNVLLDGVMSEDSAHRFRELVSAANSLGIELRVTRATLDEANSVAAAHLEAIDEVIGSIPEQVLRRSNDDFLWGYRAAKAKDHTMTPQKFMTRFEQLPTFLDDQDIVFEDKNANEIVGDRDLSRECQIINDAAEATRGWGKTDDVRLHDACHFSLVRQLRTATPKTWFLTKDRTLTHAAAKLAPDELPFCFPMVGFLQSVSPFLETPAVRHTLVDVFSAVLDGEVGDLTGRSLYDTMELRLISELHTDVLSVPVDQLLPALDYVKKNLLSGKPYRRDDHTKVALELKKYLTSSAREKQEALLARLAEEKKATAAERDKRTRAEQTVDGMRTQINHLSEEVDAAARRNAVQDRSQRLLGVAFALFGLLFATACWQLDTEIAQQLIQIPPLDSVRLVTLAVAVRVLGTLAFVVGFIPGLSLVPGRSYRLAGYGVVAAIAIGASDFIGPPTVKAIAPYLSVAAPIGLAINFLVERVRNKQKP